MKTIDARGLSCPEPVILTRQAMMSGEAAYEVLVDNNTSKENVTRYAQHQGYKVVVTEANGEFTLSLSKRVSILLRFFRILVRCASSIFAWSEAGRRSCGLCRAA